VLLGVGVLATLIFISNSREPAAEHAMFRLGLAGSALLSAMAQAMIFLGGWMLWRAARRSRTG
jgi:ABC-type nickel/cobalt efflux system permease component RcnA